MIDKVLRYVDCELEMKVFWDSFVWRSNSFSERCILRGLNRPRFACYFMCYRYVSSSDDVFASSGDLVVPRFIRWIFCLSSFRSSVLSGIRQTDAHWFLDERCLATRATVCARLQTVLPIRASSVDRLAVLLCRSSALQYCWAWDGTWNPDKAPHVLSSTTWRSIGSGPISSPTTLKCRRSTQQYS